ncbi:MAG: preprotein translocase subunit SecG [Desulfobacteraceae bacterium]
MSLFIVVLHVAVCIALIMIVLLQTGKGADMGAAFGGGGSNTLFGASGASTFLGKMTTVAAIVFMLTSVTLAIMVNRGRDTSPLKDVAPVQTTTEETAPVTEATETPAAETPAADEQTPAAEQTEPAAPEAPKSE